MKWDNITFIRFFIHAVFNMKRESTKQKQEKA